jgi:hypothetical protein
MPISLENVGIAVRDLEATIACFTDLGLTVLGRDVVNGEWTDTAVIGMHRVAFLFRQTVSYRGECRQDAIAEFALLFNAGVRVTENALIELARLTRPPSAVRDSEIVEQEQFARPEADLEANNVGAQSAIAKETLFLALTGELFATQESDMSLDTREHRSLAE